MKRRDLMQAGLATTLAAPLLAALRPDRLEEAADVLARATATGQIESAVLHVTQQQAVFTRAFGRASSENAMFLLGSISKPITVTALMTLFDQGMFQLTDRLKKFIPQFTGDRRDDVTIQHLLTHVSGLPDQLPNNDALRNMHAALPEFVEQTIRTPLQFAPGSQYQYSSMAILLAARIAELISGTDILTLVDRTVFRPLQAEHSAQGLGRFKLPDMVPVQTDRAAPESGGGNPAAKSWDWNSRYWRQLGAPWGGTHASARDVGRFLAEFLLERGEVVKPETARLMLRNHNPVGLAPRGLGFSVGKGAGSPTCSERTFGHTGSTGTVCWSDPAAQTICVVLTSLPGRAAQPHPRDVAAARVAEATL